MLLDLVDRGGGHAAGHDHEVGVQRQVAGAGQRFQPGAAPGRKAAVEEADVTHASPAQRPPCAASEESAAIVINDDGVLDAQTEVFKPVLEFVRIRQGVAAHAGAGSAGEREGGVSEVGGGDVERRKLVERCALSRCPRGVDDRGALALIKMTFQVVRRNHNAHAPTV